MKVCHTFLNIPCDIQVLDNLNFYSLESVVVTKELLPAPMFLLQT